MRIGLLLNACSVILQWDRLPACQVHRLETVITKAAARRIPVCWSAHTLLSEFLALDMRAGMSAATMLQPYRCNYLLEFPIGVFALMPFR